MNELNKEINGTSILDNDKEENLVRRRSLTTKDYYISDEVLDELKKGKALGLIDGYNSSIIKLKNPDKCQDEDNFIIDNNVINIMRKIKLEIEYCKIMKNHHQSSLNRVTKNHYPKKEYYLGIIFCLSDLIERLEEIIVNYQ